MPAEKVEQVKLAELTVARGRTVVYGGRLVDYEEGGRKLSRLVETRLAKPGETIMLPADEVTELTSLGFAAPPAGMELPAFDGPTVR